MTKEEIELTFSIINSIGALATFGAFIALFLKDKDKQKQIKKLTLISESILKLYSIEEKKMKLIVAPVLWLNGAATRPEGELKIDLNNKGERAKLIDFVLISGDIEIHNKHLPSDMEKGDSRFIFAKSIGEKKITDCYYKIEVIYQDALNNNFSFIIEGSGNKVRELSNAEFIN